MKKSKKFKVATCLLASIALCIFLIKEMNSKNIDRKSPTTPVLNSEIIPISKIEPKPDRELGNTNSLIRFNKVDSSSDESKKIIFLNSENFESRSGECFQGALCEVEGDPWKQYLALKKEGRKNVTDLYIAFLRKKMSDPKFKDQNKDILKEMIKDFYPVEEIDFQMAAYYNYLGDLESSLQIYLALERKSQTDPKMFKSPKLNIANTYYDLGRFKDALAYYQASLSDQKSTETADSIASINFINERIDIIQEKLRR